MSNHNDGQDRESYTDTQDRDSYTVDPALKALRCDTEGCVEPVTHIDSKGFIYCTDHGQTRRHYQRCRKLRPHELNRLRRGEQVKRY